MNLYLTWGGNEDGREFASGSGNFGNLMGLENVKKSIISSHFTSSTHLLSTNKKTWLQISKHAVNYAIRPNI
jgi:hypothetical protein